MNWNTIEKINICIQKIKAGDHGDAIIKLHSLIGNHLHFIAYKYLKDTIEAEDVIQDFWNYTNWLYMFVSNLLLLPKNT